MIIDPILIQSIADKIAGLNTNGTHATQFPEPLATLWQELDADQTGNLSAVFIRWAGTDQSRLDIASEIFKVIPGAPPSPDPWQLFTLKDAYKPRPPLQYIVEDILTLPSLVIVYGPPGSLKSMLIADLAVAVASGKPWLVEKDTTKRRTQKKTFQSPILWCDFDNGKRRTDERFDALGMARQLPGTTPVYYASMPNPWLDASDQLSIEELILRVKRLKARLVVIDNLGTITGKADENSAEMVQVMSRLRYLAESTQACVIVLHHQRKGAGMQARAGDALRGHSSIEAALDLALLVEREEHSEEILVKSTKTRDLDVFPFGAVFECTHKNGTKELETAFFYGVEVEDKTSAKAIEAAVIDALQIKAPLNQRDLIDSCKSRLATVGINRIRAGIDALVNLGTVLKTTGARNASFYDLP